MTKKYNLFILDLDGTVYIDGKPIGNIILQLNRLIKNGCSILFLTNNTSVCKEIYIKKLFELGLNFVNNQNIITPIDIFLSFANQNSISKVYYLLPSDVINSIKSLNGPINSNESPEIVLIGFDKELTYDKLKIASKFINQGVPFYVTHIDISCPSEFGPIPDCGAIAELIFQTTKKRPICDFGKPSNTMAKYLIEFIKNSNNKEAVLIGDRYYTDIKLGSMINIDTVHVNTGDQVPFETYKIAAKYEFDNINQFIECQFSKK